MDRFCLEPVKSDNIMVIVVVTNLVVLYACVGCFVWGGVYLFFCLTSSDAVLTLLAYFLKQQNHSDPRSPLI